MYSLAVISNLLLTMFTCLDVVNGSDLYGDCIRQYAAFALSLCVLALALYSCVRTYRLSTSIPFELLPLSINTLTSSILVGLYSQMQIYNTRLVLLVVQFYSYFILSYGYISMVLSAKYGSQIQTQPTMRIFIGVSVVSTVAVVVFSILSAIDTLECKQDQGIGSFIIIMLEIPLLLATYVYSSKYKRMLKPLSMNLIPKSELTSNDHMLNEQDQFIRVKIFQLNLVRFAFVVTMVLHTIELFCYYVGDEQIICSSDNKIQITNALELYILAVENISQLFPHFIIPIIFWYLPAKMNRSSKSLQIQSPQQDHNHSHSPLPKLKMYKQNSNLIDDVHNDQQVRKKQLSSHRHVSRVPTI